MQKVKVSVFLPSDVHHRLKILAVERSTSLQKLMEVEVRRMLGLPSPEGLTRADIRRQQARLAAALTSGHKVAIRYCLLAIDAAEILTSRSNEKT